MSKASGTGQVVNRAGLAEVAGVSLPTVDDWVRRGCPVVTRGRRGVSWEFNSADVMRWYADEKVAQALGDAPASEKDLKLRRMKAQTELDELELARARAEVVPIDEVRRVVVKAFAEVRASILVVPVRMAPQLVGEIDEQAIKAAMTSELRQALDALSETGLVSEADFEEAEGEGAGE